MQPLFIKLTKTIVVIVTAVCGNMNVTAADRILDETVQLNPAEPTVAMKSERRSKEAVRRMVAATHRHREERARLSLPTEDLVDDSSEPLTPSEQYMMPHTLFGAGSIALSALGNGAPVFVARS